MTTVKLTSIGNSTGIIIPKELLAVLGAEKGDSLEIVRTQHGLEIIKQADSFARNMAVAEQVMREDFEVLRRLAE